MALHDGMRLMRKVLLIHEYFFVSSFSSGTVVTCDQVGDLHIHFFELIALFLTCGMLMLVACCLLRKIGVEQRSAACLPIVSGVRKKLNALCIVSVSCLLSRRRGNRS